MFRHIQDQTFQALGAMGMLAGGGLLFWLLGDEGRYEALPNHLRLAAMVPLAWGATLMYAGTFRDWATASATERGRAGSLLFVAIAMPLASLAWWVLAHATRG